MSSDARQESGQVFGEEGYVVTSVYLAGPIHGKSDLECKAWRNHARSLLEDSGHFVVDPMDRDYRGRENENAERLVADDKAWIEQCDVVLVNASEPSWGTAMEVMYAISFGKRVVAFTNSQSISPWLRCHAHAIFWNLQQAAAGVAGAATVGMR